jgi:uncharacterized membrane protein YphA (DoxX/SURF4 family)
MIFLSSLAWLIIIRIGLGFFWLWQVIAEHKSQPKMEETLRKFAKENPIKSYKVFLETFLLPRIRSFWILVTALEIWAVISFILGILAPITAVLMIILEVNFLLSRPNSVATNILPMLLEFMIVFSAAGTHFALVPFNW